MKPYNERLPLIDEAIDELNGELPILGSVSADKLLLCITATGKTEEGSYIRGHSFRPNGNFWMFICTTEEFEQRVKERNSMKEYEYGVEYPCNGEKPDLPDDVLVQVKDFNWDKFEPVSIRVEQWCWTDVESFKITDPRYKPKSDWYERGDKVSYPTGDGVLVVAEPDNNGVVIVLDNSGEYRRVAKDNIKPIRTERDELIDSVAEAIHNGASKNRAYKDIAIALYDAGMLKKPEDEIKTKASRRKLLDVITFAIIKNKQKENIEDIAEEVADAIAKL